MSTTEVTDKNFQQAVYGADLPVVVDFWGEWCAPCKKIKPMLEDIGVKLTGRVKIATCNVEETPRFAAGLGVRGLPALFIINNGEVVASKAGASNQADLEKWIGENT